MSFYGVLKSRGPSGFGYSSTADEVVSELRLTGRNILITGCNSGIGYEVMRALSRRGAAVIGTARDATKARSACASAGGLFGLECDLTDPGSIRSCTAQVKDLGIKLDAVICNAGVMALPRLELVCGYEAQFFINHIAHFILVTGLLDVLTDSARIVVTSSTAHRLAPRGGIDFDNLRGQGPYGPVRAYAQSKMANLLFAKELARRFSGTERTANALHPGICLGTGLTRHVQLTTGVKKMISAPLDRLFLKTVEEAAATTCYVAAHPDASRLSGYYFTDSNIAKPRADAEDSALAESLWSDSRRIARSL